MTCQCTWARPLSLCRFVDCKRLPISSSRTSLLKQQMKVALVNPPWVFDHSVYRGCREAHLPLEFGYARQLLLQRRHDVLLCDAQLHGWDLRALVSEIAAYRPDVIVLTTAPSYLYWGCA